MTNFDNTTRTPSKRVDEFELFRHRFLSTGSLAVGFLGLVWLIIYQFTDGKLVFSIAIFGAVAVSATVYVLSRRGFLTAASNLFVYGLAVIVSSALLLVAEPYTTGAAAVIFFVTIVGCLLLSRGKSWLLLFLLMAGFVVTNVRIFLAQGKAVPQSVDFIMGPTVTMAVGPELKRVITPLANVALLLCASTAVMTLFMRRFHRNVSLLTDMWGQLGDMSRTLSGSIDENATQARELEKGVVRQTEAIREIKMTLDNLVKAAEHIVQSTQRVVTDADQTHANNAVIKERLNALVGHTNRIHELLELIRDVANKSELLALNASLEGVKAGEAGRGFSLVAAQMQRLAEQVMQSVKDVKGLVGDIRDSGDSTMTATDQGTRLAESTAQAAKTSLDVSREQQLSVNQMDAVVGSISDVIDDVAQRSSNTLSVSMQLMRMAESLNALISRSVETKTKKEISTDALAVEAVSEPDTAPSAPG